MDTVNVKKDELLIILKKNREEHREIFIEAQEGYRKAVIKELELNLELARKGAKVPRASNLIEPVDQTRDYDRVIHMLEMSQDEMIKLSEPDFNQYVLDDWRWKGQFMASNATYSEKARSFK